MTVTVSFAGNSYYSASSGTANIKVSGCGGSGGGGSGGGGSGGGSGGGTGGGYVRAASGRRWPGLRLNSRAGLV